MAKREQIPGRADTDRKKGLVMEKLLRAWKLVPDRRLADLIRETVTLDYMELIEDEELAEDVLSSARHQAGITVKKARR